MSPRKPTNATKEALLALLSEGVGASLGGTPVETLRASEVVTYPALTSVLQTLEERHNGLVALMNQRFTTLERMSQDRSDQLLRAEITLGKRIDDEVARNDKRFFWVVGSIGAVVIGEVLRFLIIKT